MGPVLRGVRARAAEGGRAAKLAAASRASGLHAVALLSAGGAILLAILVLTELALGAIDRQDILPPLILAAAAGAAAIAAGRAYSIEARRAADVVPPDRVTPESAQFLELAGLGSCILDEAGRFCFVDPTLAGWLGAEPAALVAGATRLEAFLSDPLPAPASAGEQRNLLRRPDGASRPLALRQRAVESGGVLGRAIVARDASADIVQAERMRQAHERAERLFAEAPVGIARLDRLGRVAEANSALAALFGIAPAELAGQLLLSLVNAEDRGQVAARLAAAVQGMPDTGAAEVRLAGPHERAAALFLSRPDPAAGPAGDLVLHVVDPHVIEASGQKSPELQLAQAQKMQAVGQLAGGVAHDFNNLLTAMIGFCDLLLQRFPAGDPSFADIMQIKQNANRAANLVRQLLAFSRQQTLAPRVLSVTDVLAELSHLLRRLVGDRIELRIVHGRDLGRVKVDQGQLEQVIINLVVNGRDAMPDGGTLSIRTANHENANPLRQGHEVMPPGSYVLIEVADHGVGIARENLARIFEPFFSTKDTGSGTGLGLSTVYGIVKQTGGFIFVDSAPGEGARFSIFLPRHQGVEDRPTDPAEPGEPGPGRDLTGAGTVLLVEDEDPVRLFSARALRNKGYRVLEAKSGEAALELIALTAERVDLLITDVAMPGIDGLELIRRVRAIHPAMTVIFVSGYAEESFRARLGAEGDIHFLAKPFSLKQLAGKVKEVVRVEAG